MKRIFSVLLAGAMLLSSAPVLAAEEPIINNDFESGELGFSVRGTASVEISTDAAHSGTSSMLVSGRGANGWEGVNTSIVNDIKLDETYYGQMYVKAATPGESFTVKMSIDMEDETGAQYPQIGSAKVNSSDWTLIEGTWTADYQGNLKSMNLDLETDEDGIGKSFYVDDVFLAHESVTKPQNIQIPQDTNADVTYSGIKLPSDAAETEYSSDIEKMMALGVVEGYPDGTFQPENKVTRAEYLTMLLRLFDIAMPGSSVSKYTDVAEDHFASGAIEWASGIGICSGYGDGRFGPEDNVTYAQAVKMLMSTMGYSTIAEMNGGYPTGYISTASGQGIYINGVTDDALEITRAMTAELMCKALDVGMYLRTSDGFSRDANATILSEYYDGGIVKGYVQASNDVSIDGNVSAINFVTIDGINYRVGATRAAELVGYYVEIIYEGTEDERSLLYIAPQSSRNTEFEIDSRDIESYADYTYKYYEGSKTRTRRIDKDFTLVYNGKTVTSGFDESMMMPELGSVKLLSADSSNYNMVYVTSYETFVVSTINRSTQTVYDADNSKYSLEDDGRRDITYIKPDGTEGTFSDIAADDVLHIMASADDEKITVKIVRAEVEGTVNSISGEEITLDGTVYRLSDAYKNSGTVKTGSSVTAYLDLNGDVVYIKEGSDTSMEIGYLLNAAVLESGDEIVLRYINSKGSEETANLRSKTNIDGQSYNDIDEKMAAIVGDGDSHNVEKRIFRYAENSSGEIVRLDFARAQEACIGDEERNEGAQSLYVINDRYVANDGRESGEDGAAVIKYKYKYNVRTFIDESGMYSSLAINPDTVVFKVPEPGSDRENEYEDYEVTNASSLGYDEQFKVFAYKSDTNGLTADYVVLFTDNSGTDNIRSQEGYVVTKITESLNRYDEQVQCLEIYVNGEKKSYVMKDSAVWEKAVEENNNNSIEKGDIVRFDTDAYGQISNLTVDRGTGKYSDYFYSAQGYIYLKDEGYAYFTTKRPNDSMSFDDMLLIPIDDFDIIIYNKDTEEVYEGVSGEIIDYMTDPENYSSVYITMNYETAKTLICVTDD